MGQDRAVPAWILLDDAVCTLKATNTTYRRWWREYLLFDEASSNGGVWNRRLGEGFWKTPSLAPRAALWLRVADHLGRFLGGGDLMAVACSSAARLVANSGCIDIELLNISIDVAFISAARHEALLLERCRLHIIYREA